MVGNIQVQGVIACAGQSSRFARSVGASTPYAKHLEEVGGKTILFLCVKNMAECFPVTGITFFLNPGLEEQYINQIRQISKEYSNLQFTWVTDDVGGSKEKLFDKIQEKLKHRLNNPDGSSSYLTDDPLIVFGFGDVIMSGGSSNKLKKDYVKSIPGLREEKIFSVVAGLGLDGNIYYSSRLSRFDSSIKYKRDLYIVNIDNYHIKWWNINTKYDLLEAKKELEITRADAARRK